MALLKCPCTTVWLIFMSTLLHLVLSYGESFAYASIITGVHALMCAICHYLLSTLNACGKKYIIACDYCSYAKYYILYASTGIHFNVWPSYFSEDAGTRFIYISSNVTEEREAYIDFYRYCEYKIL